ncbi:MAG: two component transcriptional regulator, LuxR family [Fibrobacteres bacterium]|nr:two component transcriptional regulator, LuxR family [Fibrobacterota bacterium]
MTYSAPLSIVIVEDNLDLAQTVQAFLSLEPGLSVQGVAHEVRGFQDLVRQHLPDLALIDIGLDTPRSGLDLLVWLRKEFPIVKPVIMTVNQGDVLEAYNLGARGYVLKTGLEILAPTLLEVSRGKLIIPPEVGELFLTQVAASDALWKKSVELERFSEREKEILRHLRAGLRREDIGDRLGISFFTVRRHIQNMLEKTGEPSLRSILDKFGEVLGA